MNVAEVVVALGVAAVFAAYWVALLGSEALRERARLREHVRASRAYYAAIEAAEDDPSFSPEVIEKSVVEVLTVVDRLWRSAPPGELQQRPDAEFVAALARSREAWLGNRLQVRGAPSVDLLRIV